MEILGSVPVLRKSMVHEQCMLEFSHLFFFGEAGNRLLAEIGRDTRHRDRATWGFLTIKGRSACLSMLGWKAGQGAVARATLQPAPAPTSRRPGVQRWTPRAAPRQTACQMARHLT